MIRVAIIADSQVHADALARTLLPYDDVEVLTPAAGGSVDVVICDRIALDELPSDGPPVVAIVEDRLADFRDAALQREVRACLPADVTPGELHAAIVAAALELTVLTSAQARRWLTRNARVEEDPVAAASKLEQLTARETQVLRMLADGLGNKEIAGRLSISDHTAKFHVAQILAKFGAVSRAEAVAIGIRRGLVPI